MDLLTLAAADNPVNHVTNHWTWKIGDYWIWSANQTNLVLAALIIVLAGLWITRRPKSDAAQGNERYLPRDPFSHMIEVICVYLRDQAVEPLLHKRTNRFLPFLLVLFFFILVNNLLGLLPIIDLVSLFNHEMVERGQAPIGGTATQNIAVTGVLALIAAVVINIAGVKELGVGGYIKHLTAGAPAFVWPIVVPIELLGTLIKPAALAIRLFANMTAGHILIAVLFMFVKLGFEANVGLGFGIGVVSTLAAVAIYFLELFVAFLQAFVFMFLTTVFISLLSHHDHEDGHGHEHTAHEVANAAMA